MVQNIILSTSRRCKSSQVTATGKNCSPKGYAQKSYKIAQVHPKIASAKYDPKNPKMTCFPEKFPKRIFLENATFFQIPSNFDVSRRGISGQFNDMRGKKNFWTKMWVKTKKQHFPRIFFRKPTQRCPTKKGLIFGRFYRILTQLGELCQATSEISKNGSKTRIF